MIILYVIPAQVILSNSIERRISPVMGHYRPPNPPEGGMLAKSPPFGD